jgi:hypothetical protein
MSCSAFTEKDSAAMMSDSQVWRINEWLRAAGFPFSRPTLYAQIHAGRIDARKVGRSTIILTSPQAYFASLPKRLGPAVGRGRRKGKQ